MKSKLIRANPIIDTPGEAGPQSDAIFLVDLFLECHQNY